MSHIIVATHGNLSKALVDTAELIIGSSDGVECFAMTADLAVADATSQLTALIEANEHGEHRLLVIADLYGGSPFKICTELLLGGHQFDLITGANLPMLVDAMLKPEDAFTAGIGAQLCTAGRNGVVDVNESLAQMEDNDD